MTCLVHYEHYAANYNMSVQYIVNHLRSPARIYHELGCSRVQEKVLLAFGAAHPGHLKL